MSNTTVICFSNQKGGVSKTTDTLNIAYCLANTYKKRVLCLDLDFQASLSLDVGLNVSERDLNTIDQLLGAYVRREIKTYEWEDVKNFIYSPVYQTRKKIDNKWETVDEPFGFDVMPSSTDLATVELTMSMMAGSNRGGKIYMFYIYDLIKCIESREHYDYILLDTPPSLGGLSVSAQVASNSIIIPSNCDLMSFRGISTFKNTADEVQEIAKENGLDHKGILGILLSSYSGRRSVDKALEEYVHDFYPTPTFTTQIRDSSDARRAVASGLLFCQVNKKAREDYDNVCKEIMFALEDPKGWKKKSEEIWKKRIEEREKK